MSYRIKDSIDLLLEGEDVKNIRNARVVLEDAVNPINTKYREKLFQSVIDKGHIDFGDIPKSAGDIKSYVGYPTMMETLNVLRSLAEEQKASEALRMCDIVLTSIKYIESLRLQYQTGFEVNCSYVMLEYNTYVYTCVEATTTLIYEFVDYIRTPDSPFMQVTLKNTKNRANAFYFEQLEKFNDVNNSSGINYRKMLEALCNNGRNNFIGTETIVGFAAISSVMIMIVPITRLLIYKIYHIRNKISDCFELQAMFLDMNRACVESNDSFTVDKRKEIVNKQAKMAQTLKVLANKIKVSDVRAQREANENIKKDNATFSLSSLKNATDNDPLVLV